MRRRRALGWVSPGVVAVTLAGGLIALVFAAMDGSGEGVAVSIFVIAVCVGVWFMLPRA